MFSSIINFFRKAFTRKKRDREWAERFDQPPAKPKHLLPLDPNDPWKT